MNRLTIGQCATLACLWEVTFPKPGNVHRSADFEDMTFADFVTSAVAIGPAMDRAGREKGVGQTVLDAVSATQQLVGKNTNLGTILLLAPLAVVPRRQALEEGVRQVLREMTFEDARLVYQGIRQASPGGMGQVDQWDLAGDVPGNLLDAMRAAASRDRVARQYAEDYRQLFHDVVPLLQNDLANNYNLCDAVIDAHVTLMARFPDSLIGRKCGAAVAEESAARASRVLEAGPAGSSEYHQAVADLDFWLRSDGHRRNPGTTADLIAAGLFVLLRDEWKTGRLEDWNSGIVG
ncbi:MAG TPA: triphosphoribosyl-dephospho-CoA synthase [Pirellulales bacterium]|nr:triphosphoribosyl-dephospho-CoA synthase [Pirellulales bacterium]